MVVTEMLFGNTDDGAQPDSIEAPAPLDGQVQHEAGATQTRADDQGEYDRLAYRYKQISRSFTAAHQRERASLQGPLLKLYAALNPEITCRWDDDYDVVMRSLLRADR